MSLFSYGTRSQSWGEPDLPSMDPRQLGKFHWWWNSQSSLVGFGIKSSNRQSKMASATSGTMCPTVLLVPYWSKSAIPGVTILSLFNVNVGLTRVCISFNKIRLAKMIITLNQVTCVIRAWYSFFFCATQLHCCPKTVGDKDREDWTAGCKPLQTQSCLKPSCKTYLLK